MSQRREAEQTDLSGDELNFAPNKFKQKPRIWLYQCLSWSRSSPLHPVKILWLTITHDSLIFQCCYRFNISLPFLKQTGLKHAPVQPDLSLHLQVKSGFEQRNSLTGAQKTSPPFHPFAKTTFSMRQIWQRSALRALLSGLTERVIVCTSLNDVRLSFLAMNFLRWRTVACAEQRIHLRFRPRSLLLLHSKQMLTCSWKHNEKTSVRWFSQACRCFRLQDSTGC